MPRLHIHRSPGRCHYGSYPTDGHGNDNFGSPVRMHNASTTTYDYGCNTEIHRLIRIATDDAGSYPWLILYQIRECVTWALANNFSVQAYITHLVLPRVVIRNLNPWPHSMYFIRLTTS